MLGKVTKVMKNLLWQKVAEMALVLCLCFAKCQKFFKI